MRRGLAVLASLPGVLPTAAALAAAEGHGGGGVPWGEILKQAVNFAILAGVLVYFLRKPLANFLKERSQSLAKAIDEAAKARAQAQEKLSAVEARMARLPGEVEALNRTMDSEAEAEAARIGAAATAEIGRIREQVTFAADQEVRKAREQLRREAADLATKAAEEIVAKSITPEDQERMVRENIEKVKGILG